MSVEYFEYKGQTIMKIITGESKDGKEKHGISFGQKKARAIVENIDEIRKFAGEPETDGVPF